MTEAKEPIDALKKEQAEQQEEMDKEITKASSIASALHSSLDKLESDGKTIEL